MKKEKIKAILVSLRPSQWIKNLAVFAPIIFAGELFNSTPFFRTLLVFIIFCLLSSASYLLNDVVDAPYDRLHPWKRKRPIASGKVSTTEALNLSFLLFFFGLLFSFWLSAGVFMVAFVFSIVHVAYSLFLKKIAVWDILAIATSFILRTFAGEVASGYHLPVWLMFTVIFLSLFIASGKRRSELVAEGEKTRPTLLQYKRVLLDFYLSLFAVSTLLSYSLFTYLVGPQTFTAKFAQIFSPSWLHLISGRKWLMTTIFPVIFGLMRYAQLVLYKKEGERPEKLITSDLPLLITVAVWGMMVIFVLYVV